MFRKKIILYYYKNNFEHSKNTLKALLARLLNLCFFSKVIPNSLCVDSAIFEIMNIGSFAQKSSIKIMSFFRLPLFLIQENQLVNTGWMHPSIFYLLDAFHLMIITWRYNISEICPTAVWSFMKLLCSSTLFCLMVR